VDTADHSREADQRDEAGDQPAVGSAFRDFFSGEAKPASTWVGVAALADPGFLIEVEATAVFD
jgi:enamine deaminase RidA (YjgF/YER057c/UK114 family)